MSPLHIEEKLVEDTQGVSPSMGRDQAFSRRSKPADKVRSGMADQPEEQPGRQNKSKLVSPSQRDTLLGLGVEPHRGMTSGEATAQITELLAQQERKRRARRLGEEGPDGCDPDVWELTRLFHARAEHFGVELATTYDQSYDLLLRRIDRTRRRNGEPMRSRENWVQIVELMITEFWDNEIELAGEAWAADQFTGPETFRALAGWAVRELAPKREGRTEDMSYLDAGGARRRAERKAREERFAASAAITPEEQQALREEASAILDEMMKGYE